MTPDELKKACANLVTSECVVCNGGGTLFAETCGGCGGSGVGEANSENLRAVIEHIIARIEALETKAK